jgi:hypothetical protein
VSGLTLTAGLAIQTLHAFLPHAELRQYPLEQEAEFERLELDADASEPELQFVLDLP